MVNGAEVVLCIEGPVKRKGLSRVLSSLSLGTGQGQGLPPSVSHASVRGWFPSRSLPFSPPGPSAFSFYLNFIYGNYYDPDTVVRRAVYM